LSLVTPRKGYKSVPWLFGKAIEIPEEWRFQKIRECCNILDSKRIPINSEERTKIQGNIPYYGANGIQGYVNDYIFDEEIILLAEDGGYFEEYKTRPIAQYVIGKSWVNNHAHVLNTKKNILLKWVFYSLVHKNITQYINGSTRTKLNQSDLQQISILIPPLLEQQKIATILSNVDNLIDSTGKVITHLKKVKTGLIQKLLTRGIGHTKFKKVPWLFGKEIEIPQEWEFKLLSEISEVIDSRHYTPTYVENGLSLILPNNVTELGLNLDNTKYTTIEDYEKLIAGNRKPHEDDIIYTRNASFGVANQVKKNQIFSLGQDLVLIKSKQIVPFLLYLILNSKIIIHQLDRLVSGSTFKRINLELIRSFIILLPPLPEQQKIASILSNIDSKITSQEQYKEKLEKLKKSLMQKLLTGEVRV
jgi:type I restriction enzyme, S subunit